ncbi:hypothetical protein MRS44_018479 [Fusarium solani]|uniref:uncharacterized protein n=1 Tax=Fusarium solani TaxID=169388 RepID=UPI0032C40E83|nr:hypothetical protein MRS44_018479 [Fusarium solani]
MTDWVSGDDYVQSREEGWRAHSSYPDGPYVYTPLCKAPEQTGIRLLEILPSDCGFHIISCKIHHVTLGSPTTRPYEALSYCWGGSSLNRWICIKNGSHSGCDQYLCVTDNLYFALWRLRHPYKSRWMWVDAICINQRDNVEKAYQVLLMRDIYANSKRAIIWLGEKDEDHSCERGLELALRVNEVADWDRQHGMHRDLFQQPPQAPALPPPTSRLWWDLFAILDRSWFSRAWIVQELAVSPDPLVVCGHHRLSWTQFCGAITYIGCIASVRLAAFSSAMSRLQLFTNLDQIRKQYQQGTLSEASGEHQNQGPGFEDQHQSSGFESVRGQDGSRPGNGLTVIEALLYSQMAEASEPQDHLFAFYGLFSRRHGGLQTAHRDYGLPDPNYEAVCGEIYRQAAVGLMRHMGNLDLLSVTNRTIDDRGQIQDDRMAGLPTWAPNWAAGALTECFLWRHFLTEFRPDQRSTHRASGDSFYTPKFDAAERKLLLQGYILGTICNVSEVVRPAPKQELSSSSRANFARGYLAYQRACRSCEDVAGMWESGDYGATGESRIRAYCQTLHGGADGFLGDGIQVEQVEFLFRIWYLSQMLPARILQFLRLDTLWFFLPWMRVVAALSSLRVKLFGWSGGLDMGFGILASRMAHRRIVRTDDWEEGGYIGLGPPLARLGDSILIFVEEGGRQDWSSFTTLNFRWLTPIFLLLQSTQHAHFNTNTPRHVTEYIGLDLEMAIETDYHEVIQLIDIFLKEVFKAVYSSRELEVIRKRWPSGELKWLDETPIIPFSQGIQMLRDNGCDAEEDLSNPDEILLGQLVREKYGTDYYVLDKFPAGTRPFYTAKDPDDPKYTRSFDIFIRGQEICSGSQRIHNIEELRANMAAAGMLEDGMDDYLTAFKLGDPPHAGAGLGLERIVAWMLELGDVRYASLFHRDPKSLPAKAPSLVLDCDPVLRNL